MTMTDAPLEKSNAYFTEGERAELESCQYHLTPERSLSVIELATSWALHVRKIDSDRTMPPDDPARWGPHDLVAALYIRDFLNRCISWLPTELGEKVIDAIRPYDDMYRAITHPDDKRIMARVAERSVTNKPWWWHRIPDSGPMLKELEEFS